MFMLMKTFPLLLSATQGRYLLVLLPQNGLIAKVAIQPFSGIAIVSLVSPDLGCDPLEESNVFQGVRCCCVGHPLLTFSGSGRPVADDVREQDPAPYHQPLAALSRTVPIPPPCYHCLEPVTTSRLAISGLKGRARARTMPSPKGMASVRSRALSRSTVRIRTEGA